MQQLVLSKDVEYIYIYFEKNFESINILWNFQSMATGNSLEEFKSSEKTIEV